jgi:hypothetical protein
VGLSRGTSPWRSATLKPRCFSGAFFWQFMDSRRAFDAEPHHGFPAMAVAAVSDMAYAFPRARAALSVRRV